MLSFRKFEWTESELFEKARSIRETVFIKEQNVPEDLEYENEDQAVHFLMLENDIAIATARYRETEKGYKLERFAMLKEHRNKGYGAKLLNAVMEDVLPTEKRIYLHAQKAAVNYYLRAGFEIEGDQFTEAGIEHFLMVYKK